MKIACILCVLVLAAALAAEGRDLRVDKEEEVKVDCPSLCTMQYQPVCGLNARGDAQTFSNPCALVAYNCLHNSDFVQTREGVC